MLTAWAITAAACALAAVISLRAGTAVRAARAARDAAAACEARADLAERALVRGAQGAVRLTLDGGVLTCGTVPDNLVRTTSGPSGEDPLARAVARLRSTGEAFRLPGHDGSAIAGSLEGGHPTLFVEPPPAVGAAPEGGVAGRLQALLAATPHPAWIGSGSGERVWANAAYARSVADADGDGLLDANALARLAGAADGPVHERVQTVVAGERRHLDVTAERQGGVLAALAVDVTDTLRTLGAQARSLDSHAATLDRLATAIAIYGPDRRLAFHNAAFQRLFELPPAFLEHGPPEERVLDRLRADRRLPETADFKAWKRDQLKGYETRDPFERWWHLPDGQTLRVIANPGSDGGVTYVYENVTRELMLERQYNEMSRVQAETIDHLGEGIASFGPDGLLRLANPAFWSLTGAPAAEVGDHVRLIAAGAPSDERHVWNALSERVTGLTDHRTRAGGRLERGERTLDYAFAPLPDGSTLATFVDVTDTVNVARALVERNSALVAADRLKNAFIEHVSYELRSPLNTIIGFTQLLTRPETGPLSDRQREYATYISTSSEALLAIIDGILDLASIDAGIMELTIGTVDVKPTIGEVLDGLKDRVSEAALRIELDVAADATRFDGDALRVRQVLYNLTSNAVAHSPHGGRITITARRDGEHVALSVRDRGLGIAEAKVEAVFERFNTSGAQGRRGGVGLGLSLVKSFVELHGGTVSVARVEGPGAELVVRFPRHQRAERAPVLSAA
ncbi:ATP-binding protein [Acuticoccus sp.]|uniref:sensor histidine kinase n=1 Tax=Acuticoccus sp. TaxID=1904378 RepID=UPI003B52C205